MNIQQWQDVAPPITYHGLRVKRGPYAFRHFAVTYVAEEKSDASLVRNYLSHVAAGLAGLQPLGGRLQPW